MRNIWPHLRAHLPHALPFAPSHASARRHEMRPPKHTTIATTCVCCSFFKDFFNWMAFLSLGAAMIELLVYFIGMKEFTYSIWGLGNSTWLFYPVDTFRFLRILVVIRFIYMQKVCPFLCKFPTHSLVVMMGHRIVLSITHWIPNPADMCFTEPPLHGDDMAHLQNRVAESDDPRKRACFKSGRPFLFRTYTTMSCSTRFFS